MPDTSDAPLDYEWGENYAYFDNYDDIIPGGITVDRFCTLLAGTGASQATPSAERRTASTAMTPKRRPAICRL